MYITLWQNFWGHPENGSFMQFSQKIDGFRQKQIHRALRTHTTLYITKPIRNIFFSSPLTKL